MDNSVLQDLPSVYGSHSSVQEIDCFLRTQIITKYLPKTLGFSLYLRTLFIYLFMHIILFS